MADYKDLEVWKRAVLLAESVYDLTMDFPKEEVYGLTNQMRRAAVSVFSNIAEGHGRRSDQEMIHFLRIARGSASEVQTQLIFSSRRNFGDPVYSHTLIEQYEELKRMLWGLILRLESRQ